MTDYLLPRTPGEAVQMLADRAGQARIMAGGTDILLDIEKGKYKPARLVDVTRIPELRTVEISSGWATIGAAVPFVALRGHPYLASHVHALVDAAASVGARAIQCAATWVGNLVQAMPAADGAIIAIALDTEVRVLDETGERSLRVTELYAGPGRSTIDPTAQLVTHIRFPIPRGRWGTGWRRAGRRPSLVLPTLNCAAKVVLEKERIAEAAIAMGPVGPCPIRAHEAEHFLRGQSPTQETVIEAARLALCDADPRSSILRASREYRLAVLPVLVEDALTIAIERAAASGEPDR